MRTTIKARFNPPEVFPLTKQTTTAYVPTTVADLSKLPKIKGFDFSASKGSAALKDLKKFIASYATTGMQASKLAAAIEVVKTMRSEQATIFLTYTSNMVSSGLRDIIRFLVQEKLVQALVTTAGGIEEDFMKCLGDFSLGDFNVNGAYLNEHGINRIGNVFVTNDFYALFETHMHAILDHCYAKQQERGRPLCTSEIIKEMGRSMDEQKLPNREQSIIYWAYKNDIPLFTPAFTDGSLCDMVFFHRQQKGDFFVDISQDMDAIVKLALNAEKSGVLALGGGSSKHYALNAQIFRDGCEFAVYINSHSEEDGSDSGAGTSEAVSWTKIKPNAPQVKVWGDATILFPLLVAGAFVE